MGHNDSGFWNDAFKEDPDHVMIPDHFLDREIEGISVGSALDLGCGSGQNSLKLARAGWSVMGVDWAEHAVQLANRLAQDRGLDALFCVGDTTTWEPPREFDLVICTYALPGGDDSERTLRTAMRALAPGGTLLVAEWDSSMTEVWNFAEGDLLSPHEITELLPGLQIEKAEVRRVAHAFSSDEGHGPESTWANVALVRARRL
jgi:2-polyprenyl-3-methyl-5-hydroxy-6-metoxy-1,4-benzoquinol methylase